MGTIVAGGSATSPVLAAIELRCRTARPAGRFDPGEGGGVTATAIGTATGTGGTLDGVSGAAGDGADGLAGGVTSRATATVGPHDPRRGTTEPGSAGTGGPGAENGTGTGTGAPGVTGGPGVEIGAGKGPVEGTGTPVGTAVPGVRGGTSRPARSTTVGSGGGAAGALVPLVGE